MRKPVPCRCGDDRTIPFILIDKKDKTKIKICCYSCDREGEFAESHDDAVLNWNDMILS